MRIPIPTIQRSVVPSVGGSLPQARAPSNDGYYVLAGGFDRVADALARNEAIRAENEQREQHDQDVAWSAEQASASRLKWTEDIERRKTEAAPDGAGFVSGAMTDFDAYTEQSLKAAPNDNARKMLAAQLRPVRERVFESSVVFEGRQRSTYRQAALGAGLDNDSRTLLVDPTQFTDVLVGRLRAINDAGGLPQEVKAKLSESARDALSYAAASTLTARDPAGMLQRINAGDPNQDPLLRHLPPARLQQLMREAQTEVERTAAQGRVGLQQRENDVQAMVLNGESPPPGFAPTVEEEVAAYGPDGARRWQDNVGNYLETGEALRSMRTASLEDRRAMIAAATPAPGEGYAGKKRMQDVLVRANQLLEQRIAEDPAAYAMQNSPRVAQAQAVMTRVLSDPKMPEADRVAAVDFFARTAAAEQERLGVAQIRDERTGNPLRGPKLLTNGQANAIAQQFYEQRQGGANAAELIGSMETQWGRWWPQVYGQLATDAKLPPAALVIPNMKDAGSRARLAQVSTMKEADLKGLLPATTDARDLRESLQGQFAAAAGTFLSQGVSGGRTVGTVIDQAERLAMLYRSQGKSISDAAAQAFDETMGWKYEFHQTYRIPREQKPDAVNAGAAVALRNLADVQVFAAPGVPMSEADQKAQTLDAVRTSGRWVTNSDETGLRLMVLGQDGTQYQVRNGAGQPVEFTWNALRGLALAADTERALKGSRLPVPPREQPRR